MSINSRHVIESCMVVGFVGVGNPQRTIAPVQLSGSGYYSPVRYRGVLTEHAGTQDDCANVIRIFTIIFGVIVFVVQLVQVS